MKGQQRFICSVFLSLCVMYIISVLTTMNFTHTEDEAQQDIKRQAPPKFNFQPKQFVSKRMPSTKNVGYPSSHLSVDDHSRSVAGGFPVDVFTCVSVTVGHHLHFPMCVFSDAEDFFISGHVTRYGALYEGDYVMKLLDVVRRHPGMGLIDIGANIGTYSLPVAHAGHPVVAVEPMERAVSRLSRSVSLGNVTEHVNVVKAAISDKRGTMHLSINRANLGGSKLVSADQCKGWHEQFYCDKSEVVSVIILDDLLKAVGFQSAVMKVDAEGSEWKIFKEPSELFDRISIPYIQIEWMWYLPGKNAIPAKEVVSMVTFFTSRKYTPYTTDGDALSLTNWEDWPKDIVWRKSQLYLDPY